MIRTVALIAILATTAATADADVYGRWRAVAGQCTPAGGEMTIGRFMIAQDEEMCVHQVPLLSTGGTVPSACSGGDGRERLVRLSIERVGDHLTVLRDGRSDASNYVRCPTG